MGTLELKRGTIQPMRGSDVGRSVPVAWPPVKGPGAMAAAGIGSPPYQGAILRLLQPQLEQRPERLPGSTGS